MKYFSIAFFIALTGCASVELSQAGRDVQLMTQLPNTGSEKYVVAGDVACDFGMNAKSASSNIIQCRNALRNKAAALGASIVIVQHQQLGTGGSGFGNNTVSCCPNCITMVGTAYK